MDESFRIGLWEIADVDRDCNEGSGSGFGLVADDDAEGPERYALGYGSSQVQTGFSFVVKEGDEAMPARCRSVTEREHIAVGLRFGTEKPRLVCTCGKGAGAATLALHGDGHRRFAG